MPENLNDNSHIITNSLTKKDILMSIKTKQADEDRDEVKDKKV